mgnify:FL=1
MAAKTRAIAALSNTPHKVLEYASGQDNFGAHAAEELGIDPRVVMKTLVIHHDRDLAVCCVPVAGHLSLKAAAKALGWKRAEMTDPSEAQRATGYVVGGISPLGTTRRMPTLIDDSVAAEPTIHVSGGQRGVSIAIAPKDLAELTGAKFAPIATD